MPTLSTKALHDIFLALGTIAIGKAIFVGLVLITQAIHVPNPYWDLAIDLVPYVFLLVLVVGTAIHWAAGERRYRQFKRKEVR